MAVVNGLTIPKHIFNEMISHCRSAFPNEACGILAGSGDKVSKIYKMTNTENSPVSYFMDSREQFRIMKEIRESGFNMLAIFHSHPSSPAYPSPKDISLASYEDCIYVIVSLMEGKTEVKGFQIKEGAVLEKKIVVNE